MQLRWYAEQIYLDKRDDFEEQRNFTEYAGSFFNPERVRRIQESRAEHSTHKFANDYEFEKQIVNKDYKENPIIKAIQKLRENQDANNSELDEEKLKYAGIKLPTNLKFLKDY